jgi:putative FmdB family regulatory protein
MPTYEYACTKCGDQFEIVQSFSDDAITKCKKCKGALRKVFGSVGIVFKGSGFYKNDSRGSSSSVTPPASDTKPAKAAESSTGSSTETPASSSSTPSSSGTSAD